MVAQESSTNKASRDDRRKNRQQKGRNSKRRQNRQRSSRQKRMKICTDSTTNLDSGVDYKVDVIANQVGNKTRNNSNQGHASRNIEQRSLQFSVAARSKRFLLHIKKRPRTEIMSPESKLKLKATIRECGSNKTDTLEETKGAGKGGMNNNFQQGKGKKRNKGRKNEPGKSQPNGRNRKQKDKGHQSSATTWKQNWKKLSTDFKVRTNRLQKAAA